MTVLLVVLAAIFAGTFGALWASAFVGDDGDDASLREWAAMRRALDRERR